MMMIANNSFAHQKEGVQGEEKAGDHRKGVIGVLGKRTPRQTRSLLQVSLVQGCWMRGTGIKHG